VNHRGRAPFHSLSGSSSARRSPGRLTPVALPIEELQQQLFPGLPKSPSPVGFITRLIVATTLPHSRPEDNEFVRHSGFYELSLLAPRSVGLPFGRYPRLALVWLATEAVRRQTPLLLLGPKLSSFAFRIGITPSSGPQGTLVRLRDQLHRLVNVTISCVGRSDADGKLGLPPAFCGGGVRLAKSYLLWGDDPPPSAHHPSYILLSQDFYDELVAHPIPLMLDVVKSFRSPLEMDVYMWLTYRSMRASRIKRPETIAWEALHHQFGADYAEVRLFRHHFLRAVAKVLKVYSTVRLRHDRNGLILLPFPPHVPRVASLKER
jgi:replication initiator protein